MRIVVNGTTHEASIKQIGYNLLCALAQKDPNKVPTVTYSYNHPDGGSMNGSITQGDLAPVFDGAVYNVAITNNA